MKRRYKRAVALILALCVTLGIFPNGSVTAQAANNLEDATVTLTQDSFTYTGEEISPGITVTTADGSPLTVGSDYEISGDAKGKDVGSYTVYVTGIGNYEGNVSADWYITAASVVITPDNKEKNYGDDDPELTATVTGALSGDESKFVYTLTREEGQDVGDYAISVNVTSAPSNYAVQCGQGVFTINPLEAVVTADTKTKVYGEDDPELTATVTGLKSGDDPSKITYTVNRTTGENVGTYSVTPSGNTLQGNYKVKYEAGTLTINKRTLGADVMTLDKTLFVYDGKEHTPTPVLLSSSYELTDADYTLSGDMSKIDVGNYSITVTATGGGNFSGSFQLNWSIAQPAVTNETVTYDGNGHGLSQVSGVKFKKADGNYDGASPLYTNVGTYKIEYQQEVNGETADGVATLTITPKTVTVTATAASKTYGDSDPELKYTITGMASGDTLSGELDREQGENAGTYTITQGTLGNANPNYNYVCARNIHHQSSDAVERFIHCEGQ